MLTNPRRLMRRTENLTYREVLSYLFDIEVGGKRMQPADTGPYRVKASFETGSVYVINSFHCIVGEVNE